MKTWAVFALCLISSFASAKDIEEVVVKARQIRVVLIALNETHRQNPITGNWHYVAKSERKNEKVEAKQKD